MSFFKRLFSKKKKEEPKQTGQVPKDKSMKKTSTTSKDGMIVRTIPIIKFTAPKAINEGEVLRIQVTGQFTSAGWKIKEKFAKVKGDKISIAVVGHMKAGMMAAQVMKKFETTIELDGLKKGIYFIKPEKGITDQTQLTVE